MKKSDLIKTFSDSISERFDLNKYEYSFRHHHSINVAKKAHYIASLEGKDNTTKYLSFVAGLLHDYGRFYQWEKYETFLDHKSECHSDMGLKKIFEENEVEKYKIPKKFFPEIKKAIWHHNKLDITNTEKMSELELFLCKVVRDADKWDLFQLMLTKDFPELSDEKGITPEVWKAIMKKRCVYTEDAKSKIDFKLAELSIIFDLNFKAPKKWINDTFFLEKYYKKNKGLFEPKENISLLIAINKIRTALNEPTIFKRKR